MSRHGEITLGWGDGRYTFRLGYGELLLLQEACDAGPAFIANRLASGHWRTQDVRETIRLGLMGAGMSQADALTKITRFVDNVAWAQNCLIAYAILQAAIIGPQDEAVGKAQGARKRKASGSPKAKSPSPGSSAPQP
jgi:hypothetical protein